MKRLFSLLSLTLALAACATATPAPTAPPLTALPTQSTFATPSVVRPKPTPTRIQTPVRTFKPTSSPTRLTVPEPTSSTVLVPATGGSTVGASPTVVFNAAATITATPAPPVSVPPVTGLSAPTNAGWKEFAARVEASDAQSAQARVDDLWNSLTASQRVPLVLDDAVIFLYKGDAASVTWRGDFSFWQFGQGVEGIRLSNTDLWYGTASFPRNSRVEYLIQLNGDQWIRDPANPRTQKSGLGTNNVLVMPDFEVTDETERRADVPAGTLTDWIRLDSKEWGGAVNYRVYTPYGYEALRDLPALYLTDGNDFGDEQTGGVTIVLDNLIAEGRLAPVVAVFIDARDPDDPVNNQREIQFLARPEDFARFLANELVRTIDGQYRTRATPAGRALVGTSYGGVFSTYAVLHDPTIFGNLAAFSPAYWALTNPEGTGDPDKAAGASRMNDFIQNALDCKPSDLPCPASRLKIWMSAGLPEWDVGDLSGITGPLQAGGASVTVIQTQEGHNWGAWRGETDEMLIYLFGK